MQFKDIALALAAALPLVSANYGGGGGGGSGGNSSLGADKDGKYWIYGDGLKAAFIPYGASVSNLMLKDQYGIERDVVGGFDNASYYSIDGQHPHFGGVPGRYANRIKNSTFTIDGKKYHITPNENARGDAMTYVKDSDVITLTGHVVLAQGKSVAKGDKLIMYRATGQNQLISDSPQTAAGRVRVILYPQQQAAATPAKPPAR